MLELRVEVSTPLPAISGKGLKLVAVAPGERITFKALVKPSRRLAKRKKTRQISITTTSMTGAPLPDRVCAKLIKKN